MKVRQTVRRRKHVNIVIVIFAIPRQSHEKPGGEYEDAKSRLSLRFIQVASSPPQERVSSL